MNILLILIFNICLSWFITNLIITPFKKILPDIPNNRSAHNSIKPRGGGISFITSIFISSLIFDHNFFILLYPLCFISFLDDLINIKRWVRFIFQISTSFILFLTSNYFDFISEINNTPIEIILTILIVIFATGIINFCNFMDGIDGILTGSILIILISSLLISSTYSIALIGSLIGFLIWNWEPSKIFMGDIGSNFLGGVVVWTLLNSNSINNSIGLLLIAMPLLLDPFVCLLRRLINKQNIFKAHSLHLYQRLNKGGLSHRKISTIYIFSSFTISFSYFFGGLKLGFLSLFLIIIFGCYLEKKYATLFKYFN